MRNPKYVIASLLTAALAVLAPPALAGDAAPAKPKLEPKALEILKAASDTLSKSPTIVFTAVVTYERAARNGQPLYYSTVNDVTLQRPDKLRVIKRGDGPPDEFYFDGKTIVAYVPGAELVAVAEAPGSLDKMLDHAFEKAAIYFPFADMLTSDPYGELSKVLKSAFYIGQSVAIAETTTDMIALAGDDVAAQIWIGAEDHLPRLVRVIYANEPAHARYQTEYSHWKLGEPVAADAFKSEKAAKAKQIPFAPPGAARAPQAAK